MVHPATPPNNCVVATKQTAPKDAGALLACSQGQMCGKGPKVDRGRTPDGDTFKSGQKCYDACVDQHGSCCAGVTWWSASNAVLSAEGLFASRMKLAVIQVTSMTRLTVQTLQTIVCLSEYQTNSSSTLGQKTQCRRRSSVSCCFAWNGTCIFLLETSYDFLFAHLT